MSEPIISIDGISKRYIIGHQRAGDGLRHIIENAVRNPLQWLRGRRAARQAAREEFWALKNVSFDISQGESVAIIGRNGAGKSTLLKILSRITEPTTGRIKVRGRVASLLEVGTGFHQDLTGRENIFLNGAILGMSRAEIRRKFDEIVAFSEIDRFLDTPVKRYSSGMYVRLAFAVAAHLEPEILVVDEVLAVGDASFQKKCMDKMGDVAKGGRTVIFVSHNLSAVQALCKRAVYLKAGTVVGVGDVDAMVNRYLVEGRGPQGLRFVGPRRLGPKLELLSFAFAPTPVKAGDPLRFSLVFKVDGSTTLKDMALLINSENNARVALVDLRTMGLPRTLLDGERIRVAGEIGAVPFVDGDYSVGINVNTPEFWENVFDLAGFTVTAPKRDLAYTPHPVAQRGLLELNFQADVTAV